MSGSAKDDILDGSNHVIAELQKQLAAVTDEREDLYHLHNATVATLRHVEEKADKYRKALEELLPFAAEDLGTRITLEYQRAIEQAQQALAPAEPVKPS